MAKITHHIDEDGNIIRETRQYGRVTRERVTQSQVDMHELGSGLFGCVGAIVGLFVMFWFLKILGLVFFV